MSGALAVILLVASLVIVIFVVLREDYKSMMEVTRLRMELERHQGSSEHWKQHCLAVDKICDQYDIPRRSLSGCRIYTEDRTQHLVDRLELGLGKTEVNDLARSMHPQNDQVLERIQAMVDAQVQEIENESN